MQIPQLLIRKHLAIFFAIFAFLVATDQLTKAVAKQQLASKASISVFGDFINLSYIENPFGFLGILINVPEAIRDIVLTLGVALILIGSTIYIISRQNIELPPLLLSTALLAGGTSNLLDRLLQQVGVIDFISFNFYFFSTGLCNLADIYIFIGSFGLGFILAKRL